VQAEVTVSSEAVRGMIESQLPELKQRLEAAGLTVSKFDVNTQTGGGSNPHRTPNQANPWDPPAGGIFPNRAAALPPPTTVLVGGTLDVTA
jgi:flagellar hook-length control protein FliK